MNILKESLQIETALTLAFLFPVNFSLWHNRKCLGHRGIISNWRVLWLVRHLHLQTAEVGEVERSSKMVLANVNYIVGNEELAFSGSSSSNCSSVVFLSVSEHA